MLVIFRNLRARDILNWIDAHYGKVPAIDLDPGILWATDQHLSLAGSRGKVVAILFGKAGDRRSYPFLRRLDSFWKSERKNGLELALVGLAGSTPSTAEQLDRMRQFLKGDGLEMPAGLDPSGMKFELYKALGAMQGWTASLVVFDRAGRAAWYLVDPTAKNAGMACAVISRLLAEEPGKTAPPPPRKSGEPKAAPGGPDRGKAAAAGEEKKP